MSPAAWAAIAAALAFLLNVGIVVFYGGRLSQKVENVGAFLAKDGPLDDRIERKILTHQIKCPAARRAPAPRTDPAMPIADGDLG